MRKLTPSGGRLPLLPTAASRLKSWTADAGEDKGGAGKPGLSIKQVLYYLGLLLLGMFVAVLMEQTEDNAATKNTSSKSPLSLQRPTVEAIAVRSLYDVLAPSKEASQPAAPVVRLIDTGRASGAASSPAVPELQVMKSSHQAHLPEPARQPPEAAALPGAPEPKDGQAAETSGMAAIRRTPVGEMWGVASQKERCDNTCPSANNGRCEDGSSQEAWPAQAENVKCDLGTDCNDCGPWKGKVLGSLALPAVSGTMIKDLGSEGTEVLIRGTSCPPYFIFAYTNPRHDVDVSAHVHYSGMLEGIISFTWYKVLVQRCKNGDLVADVGGNFGWYTVLAAKLGCRVVTWEPVPRFRAFLLYNILVNGVGHLVEVRDTVVSNDLAPQTVVVPQRGIWGTAGVNGMNIDKAIDNEGEYLRIESEAERLDDVVKENAALLKVDVEGYEPSVMASAHRLISERAFDHIMLEYSPGVGDRAHDWKQAREFPVMLKKIIRAGYTVRSYETPGVVIPSQALWDEPNSQLPVLEMVTEENLKYDIHDMDNAVENKGSFACVYKPVEVQRIAMHNNCGAIPEGFHPMSFHSVFSHNTNIWAVRSDKDSPYPKGPVTGTMKPSEDESAYFATRDSPDGIRGMGGRVCKHLPPEVQVHHRCRCSNHDICGEEEAKVEEAYRRSDRLASQTLRHQRY